MKFRPDYTNLVDAARNKVPKRLPLYEHSIHAAIMEEISGEKFMHYFFLPVPDYEKFFVPYNRFFLDHGYDTVSFEAGVSEILPHGGALSDHGKGYITDRERFESYPFDELLGRFCELHSKRLRALTNCMPDGMRAVGGVGNGVFEVVQDLVGYENLCIMSYEDPQLYADIFNAVGDAELKIWKWLLDNYGDTFCVCRFGDDLGYKSNTLLSHDDIRKHILPQYKKIVDLVHSYGKPFLLHSCGCIFDVMDDLIGEVGIDAKHSNEDQIAPYRVWVERYGGKIGNFGGIDTDHLVRMDADSLRKKTEEVLALFAEGHGGMAVGSGNSIPDYVDIGKYLLMVDTVRSFRGDY